MKSLFLMFVGLLFFYSQPISVLAYNFEEDSGASLTAIGAGYGEANLIEDSIAQIVGNVIRQVMLYLGVFFLLLTIYAGFIWMIARGNEQEIEKSKKILQNAIIGLIVVLLAYAITYLFMAAMSGAQGNVPEIIE